MNHIWTIYRDNSRNKKFNLIEDNELEKTRRIIRFGKSLIVIKYEVNESRPTKENVAKRNELYSFFKK